MPIRVVLVEDSPSQAEIAKIDLESINSEVQVEIASSARSALSTITHYPPPDLVVLDVNLPDGSGLDVCRTLKQGQLTANIPIIMFSSEGISKNRQEAMAAGAEHYIVKGGTGDITLRLMATSVLQPVIKRIPRLGEILLAKGYMTKEQLKAALEHQAKSPPKLLGQLLVELKYITSTQLLEALQEMQRK